jgi:hypothetical protein
MVKTPDQYRLTYNIEPITMESIHDDVMRFDTQLAQQVMQNIHNQQGNNNNRFDRGGGGRGRGRGRGRHSFRGQNFRPRPNFPQPNTQHFNHPTNYQPRPFNRNPPNPPFYQQNNFHLPTTYRPRNANFLIVDFPSFDFYF